MQTERTFLEYLRDVSENASPLDFMLIADNLDRFVAGAWVTLQLTFLALLLGGLIAVPLAIARAYRRPGVNQVILGYTYAFRGTPLLVQTHLFYFGLGQFEVVRNSFLWDPILSDSW